MAVELYIHNQTKIVINLKLILEMLKPMSNSFLLRYILILYALKFIFQPDRTESGFLHLVLGVEKRRTVMRGQSTVFLTFASGSSRKTTLSRKGRG